MFGGQCSEVLPILRPPHRWRCFSTSHFVCVVKKIRVFFCPDDRRSEGQRSESLNVVVFRVVQRVLWHTAKITYDIHSQKLQLLT